MGLVLRNWRATWLRLCRFCARFWFGLLALLPLRPLGDLLFGGVSVVVPLLCTALFLQAFSLFFFSRDALNNITMGHFIETAIKITQGQYSGVYRRYCTIIVEIVHASSSFFCLILPRFSLSLDTTPWYATIPMRLLPPHPPRPRPRSLGPPQDGTSAPSPAAKNPDTTTSAGSSSSKGSTSDSDHADVKLSPATRDDVGGAGSGSDHEEGVAKTEKMAGGVGGGGGGGGSEGMEGARDCERAGGSMARAAAVASAVAATKGAAEYLLYELCMAAPAAFAACVGSETER